LKCGPCWTIVESKQEVLEEEMKVSETEKDDAQFIPDSEIISC
jgi:hypothetical protein